MPPQRLSCDHHLKVVFVAVTTVTVIERKLLDILSDAEERMDLARSAWVAVAAAADSEVLAQSISENDSFLLLLRSTKLGYGMSLGTTGGLFQ